MGHEAMLLGPASSPLKPDRYTLRMGGTIRFFSPGDAASVNLNPLIVRQVRDFLAERDFDVFHLHEPFVPFLGPAFLRVASGPGSARTTPGASARTGRIWYRCL